MSLGLKLKGREALLSIQEVMEPAVILSDELILEIISRLPVKSLMKFMCLSKLFKTLISDPYFVQMHLNKSSRNLHLALVWQRRKSSVDRDSSLATLSIPRLLQNQLITFHDDPYYRIRGSGDFVYGWRIVGSCNGLLCLINNHHQSLCFWNPATRTKSENFRIFYSPSNNYFLRPFKFSFGYDNSTGTYKVVAFYVEVKRGCNRKSVVKVFNLGDNAWRGIQRFPVLPLYWFHRDKNNSVYLNSTINWLTLRDYFKTDYDFGSDSTITVEQYAMKDMR